MVSPVTSHCPSTSSNLLALCHASELTPSKSRIKAAIILMKLCFATGVLAIPSALHVVGYGPGIILLLCWSAMTTCEFLAFFTPSRFFVLIRILDYAYIMYLFRMKYRGVHNIADATALMGGPIAREIAGGLFLLTWVYVSNPKSALSIVF